MGTLAAPKGFRLHIGLFGRRNVGKSSLLNALTRQDVSIVSDVAGTTTDPVEKPMELLPLGPVLFIDTAGIDDVGALGEMRVQRTRHVFDRTDVGVVIAQADLWGQFEDELLAELAVRDVPTVVVLNKVDVCPPEVALLKQLESRKLPIVQTVAIDGRGVLDFREALIQTAPEEFINPPSILGDLVPAGELAMLVVPIDLEAPKGRLILPQVNTIRDLLDNEAYCMIAKDGALGDALDRLKRPPVIVITDSQAFLEVAEQTPNDIPMTSFSIVFARYKGDLAEFVRGVLTVDGLSPGDHVLIAEACSHHPIADDIGRVKIPRWLTQCVGARLQFTHVQGHDFPDDLSPYDLVVHCGACVWNRREMLSRILRCRQAGVPVTNYGITIAHSLGILERALAPFPAALDVLSSHRRRTSAGPAAEGRP